MSRTAAPCLTIAGLLRAIKASPKSGGICGQPAMTHLSIKAYSLVRRTMEKWPKYSGSFDYPVPSTESNLSPFDMYHRNAHSLWDANTEYGQLRIELLDWLIEQPELSVRLYKMRAKDNSPILSTEPRK